MNTDRMTLARFLAAAVRARGVSSGDLGKSGDAGGELSALILDVATVCSRIADHIRLGGLAGVLGSASTKNTHGETQQALDLIANDMFLRANEAGGHVAGMISEEMEAPLWVSGHHPDAAFLLAFDPLDGSSNIDVNVAVGSIFSILRAPARPADHAVASFLQPGSHQVCAGYAIYGPATMLVLTIGHGVHGFTLEPKSGEFILTHPAMTIPQAAAEFAINASNSRFWDAPVRRYIDECLAGTGGPRGKDFNMRWVASLVAEAHRILMRGGVFLYPRDRKDPTKAGRLRLLYEANPISFIAEQAGGRAISGAERILDIAPTSLHQRIGLIFGAREEVDRIEAYHREQLAPQEDAPLFGHRGLFRTSA